MFYGFVVVTLWFATNVQENEWDCLELHKQFIIYIAAAAHLFICPMLGSYCHNQTPASLAYSCKHATLFSIFSLA